MFCENCGERLQPGSAFCPRCGARVSSDAQETGRTGRMPHQPAQQAPGTNAAPGQQAPLPHQAAPQAGQQSNQQKWRTAAIVAVCVVVLLAIVAVCLLVFGGKDNAADPAATGGQPAATQGASNGTAPNGSAPGGTSADQAKTALNLFVSQVDNAAFPQMTLYVRLTDQAGAEVSGVDASQFSVVELGSDGTEHQATVSEVLPVGEGDMMNINLVVDQSASMSREGKIGNAKAAAHAFIDEITALSTNNAEITSFDDRVYNRQPFTSNAVLLDSAVDALSTDGDTALYDALYWALQRTNMRSGSRVVIAFTDGEENSSRYSASDVIELSRMTGIPVYLVGVGDEVDASSLRSLATSCNGQYFDASTADLAQALQGIYDSIYADQRSMYRVVYTSTFEGETTAYRTVRLACTNASAFQGTVEASYMPVDNVSSYENSVNMSDYVLEDSASRYYSTSELQDMSLWELYLARNEIFARHGRGFKNQDLVDYFATRSWYTERYTPEQFDAMTSPLNDYERKNVEAMYAIEAERNSPYLVTAD